jgi:DnaJ-class molecular chaperone
MPTQASLERSHSMAKKEQAKSGSSKDDEICELCAGTGRAFQSRSARKGQPDLGSLHCAVCGGTGRIKKPKKDAAAD